MAYHHSYEYLIYPKNYVPFGSVRYRKAKTLRSAINIARQFGEESTIQKTITYQRHKRQGYRIVSSTVKIYLLLGNEILDLSRYTRYWQQDWARYDNPCLGLVEPTRE